MAKIQHIFALVFFLATLSLHGLLQAQIKVYNQKKSLANRARTDCTDLDIAGINSDGVDGSCYSFVGDFQITQELCSGNILSESICGRCMQLEQTVQQWQPYFVEVCRDQRSSPRSGVIGDGIQTYDLNSPDTTQEQRAEYEAAAKRRECHTERREGWKKRATNEHGINWSFPSSNEQDQGRRIFNAEEAHISFKDPNSANTVIFGHSSFEPKKMDRAHAVAIQRTGNSAMDIWNATDFYSVSSQNVDRDPTQFCVEHNEALELVGGLTNAEFKALPNYGNQEKYPKCSEIAQANNNGGKYDGAYKVEANCIGQPQANVRIVGQLVKDANNGTAHFGPYSHPNHPNVKHGDLEFPVYLFVWQDGSLNLSDAIEAHIAELGANFKKVKNGFNFAMFITVLLMLCCLKAGKSSSSSSSS